MATCRTNLRKHPTKKSTALRSHLVLDIKDVVLQDISDIVTQVTNCEIAQQKQLGNKVTNTFVNGRPSGLETIRRQSGTGFYVFKTRAVFGAPSQIVEAAKKAYELLRTLTRFKTGAAVGSYNVYLGNTANTGNPGTFMGTGLTGIFSIKDKVSQNSMVSIIGPNVIYGRKLYWNPKGNKTVAKRLPNPRIRGLTVKLATTSGGYRGSATIHRDVKKRMARNVRFKSLSFGDPFFVMWHTNIIGDRRVPAITIMPKAAGRLN